MGEKMSKNSKLRSSVSIKKISITLRIVIICLMFLCSTFIRFFQPKTPITAVVSAKEDYEVFSAPSTVKFRNTDIDYSKKGSATLDYNAVKNEYESVQLMIVAKQAVNSFSLSLSDLKSSSNIVFSKDNFTVYYEKFVAALTDTDARMYQTGYYADALVPQEYAKPAGEQKIDSGKLGGFWITVYVPKNTVADVYNGEFVLTINGSQTKIPVKLNVNDFVLTDEINANSTFTLRYDKIAGGELDDSNEMVEKYYDFFLDYRISPRSLPIESVNPKELVEYAIKYYGRYASFAINTTLGEVSMYTTPYADVVKELILGLAENSNTDRNLLSKAIFWMLDEPNLNKEDVARSVVYDLKFLKALLEQIVIEIDDDTTGKYNEFKQINDWKTYITDIPNVVPISSDMLNTYYNGARSSKYINEFLTLVNTLCPLWTGMDDSHRDAIYSLAEEYDCDLWWYGCISPAAPYPTYHVADYNLLSARTVSWLQLKYNILGNLYWDCVSYVNEANGCEAVDVFNAQVAITGVCVGDGNLSYPGNYYGYDGPMPSMRLMSIRDGMEEYEMLLNVKKSYEDISNAFGVDIDIDAVMDSFYNKLAYSGMMMYSDGESGLDFTELRGDLIKALCDTDVDLGFLIEDTKVINNIAEITYYVGTGYTVMINGQTQTPISDGVRYSYLLNLNERTSIDFCFTNKATGEKKTITKFISNPSLLLCDFNDKNVCEHISVSTNSAVSQVADITVEGKSIRCDISSYFTGNIVQDMLFKPSVSISKTAFASLVDFSKLNSFKFDVYNCGDECSVDIMLYSGNTYQSYGKYTLKNGWNTVSIPLTSIAFSKLSSVDRIVLEFNNQGDINIPKNYTVYIDNMTAELKGEN